MSADAAVEMPSFTPPMVPADGTATPEVAQLDYDPITGRFTALLSITAAAMAPSHSRLSGRIVEMVDVAVATRRLMPGDVVGAADVSTGRLRSSLVRADVARLPGQAIGMAVRRPVPAGAPFPLAELGRPVTVAKGTPVQMLLTSPGLSLTAQGLAMEGGGVGGPDPRAQPRLPRRRGGGGDGHGHGPRHGGTPSPTPPGAALPVRVASPMRIVLAIGLALSVSGCGTLSRLAEVGRPPAMTPTADPTGDPSWRPVTMPMPRPDLVPTQVNSLWRSGSRAFFKDQRAAQVGDIVTVLVNITDTANIGNATSATRSGNESEALPAFLGLQAQLPKLIAKGLDVKNLVSATSANSSTGTGTIKRSEAVTLRLAGVVTQLLPNGNLVVSARQEVRVNSELRQLAVSGVVRPQDIASDNTVQHDRMAEARIAYGGRGTLTDVQTPRYGQQVLDAVLPF